MRSVTTFSIQYAHRFYNFKGEAQYLHGHTGILTIEVEDKQLIVRGQHTEDEKTPEHQYLYRGIAARQFQRSFILADGVEVMDAHLENGLLCIDLEQNEPETKIRQIKISKKSEKTSEKPRVEKKS